MNDTITMSWAWQLLIRNGIATEAELVLVTKLNGYKMETLEDVLSIRSGYESFEQLEEEHRYN